MVRAADHFSLSLSHLSANRSFVRYGSFFFFPLFSFFGLNLSPPLDCKTESTALYHYSRFQFSIFLSPVKIQKILARKVTSRKKLNFFVCRFHQTQQTYSCLNSNFLLEIWNLNYTRSKQWVSFATSRNSYIT